MVGRLEDLEALVAQAKKNQALISERIERLFVESDQLRDDPHGMRGLLEKEIADLVKEFHAQKDLLTGASNQIEVLKRLQKD
jgi:hypothetical protein